MSLLSQIIEDNEEAREANETDELTVPSEDFIATTYDDYEAFNTKAWNAGNGYETGTFPIFDEKMEGLEQGLFLFAGESNHGKSAILLELLWSYCMNEDNKLFGIYFSLDDTKDKIIPRLIAKNQKIPISVVSKPQRYQNAIDNRIDNYEAYPELLEKREAGFEELRQTADRFKVVDGTQITCGEQLIDYCQKLQAYIRAANGDDWNIIVGIDSVSDVEWHGQTFKSENEENNFNAKQLKRLAVEMLHCPVFGSIHLRKVDQNKRPTIADVKESGRYVYEADLVFLVYNDVCRNKESAAIYFNDPGSTAKGAVVELDWAKNKVSSFKGRTYQNFFTNYSKMVECTVEETERFNRLIYSR